MTERKPRRRRTAQTLHSFPVTMAKGIHLFPYRTQKLSLSAPMVLGWRRPGRVGRCRIPQRKSLRRCLGFFLCASCQLLLPGRFQANVQHCTWLGSPVCAASGGSSTWGNTWESRTLPDSATRNPAHIRRARPYGSRKKPPVLYSGRLFAYSSDFET